MHKTLSIALAFGTAVLAASPAFAGNRQIEYMLNNFIDRALNQNGGFNFNSGGNRYYNNGYQRNNGPQQLSQRQINQFLASCGQVNTEVVNSDLGSVNRVFCDGEFVGFTVER